MHIDFKSDSKFQIQLCLTITKKQQPRFRRAASLRTRDSVYAMLDKVEGKIGPHKAFFGQSGSFFKIGKCEKLGR